ncbi:MAG: metallophosphoesterase [Oscillospiraceae bacterium]|nr:metallophosphoesterase [Oscillospiraceae bacterium]
MFIITGDTHGDFGRVGALCEKLETTKEDVLIILGDAGVNYYGGKKDLRLKHVLAGLPITLFCIHGNHERRPESLGLYEEAQWCGGTVYVEHEFPNLLFAKDGEVFEFSGKKCIVIGGAYSVDKDYRLSNNWGWWPDEQPSETVKHYVEQQLDSANWHIDVVLSHTAPLKYEPREVFLGFVDDSEVDKSTEVWLGAIEDRLDYDHWYCGHYHTNKTIDKMRFLFGDYLEL